MADPFNDLENIFTYHAPNDEQKAAYQELRSAALTFAEVMKENCPPCADRTAALRLLRECVMTANASIALDGAV